MEIRLALEFIIFLDTNNICDIRYLTRNQRHGKNSLQRSGLILSEDDRIIIHCQDQTSTEIGPKPISEVNILYQFRLYQWLARLTNGYEYNQIAKPLLDRLATRISEQETIIDQFIILL